MALVGCPWKRVEKALTEKFPALDPRHLATLVLEARATSLVWSRVQPKIPGPGRDSPEEKMEEPGPRPQRPRLKTSKAASSGASDMERYRSSPWP